MKGRWNLKVVDFNSMEFIDDRIYKNDTELLRFLIGDKSLGYRSRKSWDNILTENEECGIEFELNIKGVSERKLFVSRYFKCVAEKFFSFDSVKRSKNSPHRGNSGVPDYTFHLKNNGENVNKVYVELKWGSDGIRRSQLEWMLNKMDEKENIWIMFIDTP